MTTVSCALVRGGASGCHADRCRSAYHDSYPLIYASRSIGFRVVCTAWRKPVRGGSIYGSTTALRSATRGFTPMALNTSVVGFRVVCLPPEVTP
jgi:formylglycine-generating enzyme required for sulfatase activity